MKKTIILQFFILTAITGSLLCSENIEINNLEQRKQAVKDYIRQSVEKGESINDILFRNKNSLNKQSANTTENHARSQAYKAKEQSWRKAYNNNCWDHGWVDTPLCNEIKEEYTKIDTEYNKLRRIHDNTPEQQAYNELLRFRNYKDEYLPGLLERKQDKEKEIQALVYEQDTTEEKIQESRKKKQEILDSLSLYDSNPLNTEANNRGQRKQAVTEFMRKKIRKGNSLAEIQSMLWKPSRNTIEYHAYIQADETNDQLAKTYNNECFDNRYSFIDTPPCNLMKENYKKSRKECKKLEKESQNTPEWQALEAIKEFLEIKEYIPRLLRTKKNIEKKIEAILKQKQTIKEKIQDFAKEEKELLDSLIK